MPIRYEPRSPGVPASPSNAGAAPPAPAPAAPEADGPPDAFVAPANVVGNGQATGPYKLEQVTNTANLSAETLVAHPADQSELRNAICWAKDNGKKVRLGGGRHGFNRLAFPDAAVNGKPQLIIDMRALQNVEVDKASGTAWADAGTSLKKLTEALDAEGLALPTLPTSGEVTVGGAIANGVHGSALNKPAAMGDFVEAVEVIGSDGQAHVYEDEATLRLLRANMGLFGVVSRVKLKAEPQVYLEHKEYVTDDQPVFDQLPDLIKQNEHVFLWWYPTEGRVAVRLDNEVAAPASPEEAQQWRGLYDAVRAGEAAALAQVGAAYAALGPANHAEGVKGLLYAMSHPTPEQQPPPIRAKSHEIMLEDFPGKGQDMSVSVPLERAREAMDKVKAIIQEDNYLPHVAVAIRFVKGDKSALSQHDGRDSVVIEMLSNEAFPAEPPAGAPPGSPTLAYRKTFEKIEAALRELGGKPHPGKAFIQPPTIDSDELAAARRLSQTLDPDRMFLRRDHEQMLGLTTQ